MSVTKKNKWILASWELKKHSTVHMTNLPRVCGLAASAGFWLISAALWVLVACEGLQHF